MYSDDEQKVREVTSVMMTTSGFISEAREGKLPESRLPAPFFDEEGIDVKPKKVHFIYIYFCYMHFVLLNTFLDSPLNKTTP